MTEPRRTAHHGALSSKHENRQLGCIDAAYTRESPLYGSTAKCAVVRRGAPWSCPADLLLELARQVRRLTPDRHDPERFHLDKSEVERALVTLARDLEGRQ